MSLRDSKRIALKVFPLLLIELYGNSIYVLVIVIFRMSEDLHRKHCHLEMDAQSRKEGHISPNNWKEMYLKRNVKKKQMKTRTCEVCRVSYSNYLDVGPYVCEYDVLAYCYSSTYRKHQFSSLLRLS